MNLCYFPALFSLKDDIFFFTDSFWGRSIDNRFDNNEQSTAGGSYDRIGGIGASTSLKRVRKTTAELTSDALIRVMPKKSKSRTPILSQDLYESEGLLMEIDVIEKHFALPKGVVLVDSEPNIVAVEVQVVNHDMKNVLTRGIMSSTHYINTPLLLVLLFVVLYFLCWTTKVNDIMLLHYF
ncbi:hypothetical protein Cgig2_019194 [Carnegiea gigantea]|uniref:Uncharacterized protein n=1 Tax=Carnegiea gigantea TaxID=171969 RepID=A0A9Q1K3H6_9CARY|nr:hypothetical protein Cgig2_019194 [Carnegiea gigantea]